MADGAKLLAAGPTSCRRVTLTGEVRAGAEWRAALGEGWVLRVLPISTGQSLNQAQPYTGWDLVVDRAEGAGYPDALLLATPPYRSINEREIGTTFGLRAQDAIGWNPRSFRFLTSVADLRRGQAAFAALGQPGTAAAATRQLMELEAHAATGQFRVLDARLTPGVSDAAPYAQNWAQAVSRTPYTIEAAGNGRPTPQGEIHWMRFSITFWLPQDWKIPPGISGLRSACVE
jgi:hypothetical protein